MDARLRRLRRPLPALLGVTVLALVARLVALGARVAHQDEGRVADWILHYMTVGRWQYRPIIHGPFLPHVNGVVFSVLGASDVTMRLVTALGGGLLPLAAYLYRDRLGDDEVVAFGLLLAASPALLYYSRFMRNDLLVAACMVTALGFWSRAHASRRARYVLAGALPFALAFTMKENALLYPVAWLGAGVLVVDRHLLVAAVSERGLVGSVADTVREWVRTTDVRTALAFLGALPGAVVLFVVVIVAFYAPIPDVYGVFGSAGAFVHVVDAATVETWQTFADTWTTKGMTDHSTVTFVRGLAKILAYTATITCVFAVVGFCRERYGRDGTRNVVEFCFYWGAASVFGYAVVTDIMAGWLATHVVAPLALPAAVGLAWVYRVGKRGYASGDAIAFRVAAVVLLVSAAGVGGTAAYTSYAVPQDADANPLVQYAQPAGHMKPTLHEIRDVSRQHDGIDVLFYGDEFANSNDLDERPTLDVGSGGYPGWFARLPLPWYFDRYGARVGSTTERDTLAEYDPPVVIALKGRADDVRETLDMDAYTERTYQGYQSGRPLVFFVRDDATAGGT
ncbi:flippase activity-associated protein Agl23, partial [Halarchaeum acidiphilum]|uniref:flippase activity-associated protein Agl23 n=1 Tax=Halarchaeum acidiphilum TaxID=489138 RepID=UPI00035F2528